MRINKNFLIIGLVGLVLIVFAFYLRFYRLNEQLMFTYDEAEDVFSIQPILHGHLILVGPTTGIGGFLLGPFYYYLIAPFYWFGQGNPFFPITFLIILDVIGIIIASFLAKKEGGWLSFFLCFIVLTTNVSNINYSRWLSNPNPILFFAPIYFFLLYKLTQKGKKYLKDGRFFYILGFLLGILLQTELANAIFFVPITILVIIIKRKFFNKNSLIKIVASFLLTLVPVLVYNFQHQFIMIKALINYFLQKGGKMPFKDAITNHPQYFLKIFISFFSPKQSLIFIICFLIVITYLIIKKFWRDNLLLILTLWLFLPLFFLLFYTANNGTIWDYYLISKPFPLIIIFSLALTHFIKKFKIIGTVLAVILIFFIVKSNLQEWSFTRKPECNAISLGNMEKTIDLVYHEAQGKPFNLDVFVPNLRPIAWDYLISWYGENKYHYKPNIGNKRDHLLFLIMEPGQKYVGGEQYWRIQWYKEHQNSGKIINTYHVSEIDIEKRERLSL